VVYKKMYILEISPTNPSYCRDRALVCSPTVLPEHCRHDAGGRRHHADTARLPLPLPSSAPPLQAPLPSVPPCFFQGLVWGRPRPPHPRRRLRLRRWWRGAGKLHALIERSHDDSSYIFVTPDMAVVKKLGLGCSLVPCHYSSECSFNAGSGNT
jgi:hypothetical protein